MDALARAVTVLPGWSLTETADAVAAVMLFGEEGAAAACAAC